MAKNYTEEHDALASQFDKNWRTVPLGGTYLTPISWENVDFTPPQPPAPWVEFNVLNGDARQTTFGSPGSNNFRHNGVVSINVYVPAGGGKIDALELADKVAAIFRVQRGDGILFRAPFVTPLGEDGGYYRANVSIGFIRDSAL